MFCVVYLGFIACGIRVHTCSLRNWFSVGNILRHTHLSPNYSFDYVSCSIQPLPPRVLQAPVNWLGPASGPSARMSQTLPILPSNPHRLRGPASQIPQLRIHPRTCPVLPEFDTQNLRGSVSSSLHSGLHTQRHLTRSSQNPRLLVIL